MKKFIGDDPDGEIEMGAETRSGHRGPRLSMEARRRLEFAAESSDRNGGQNFDYTGVVNQ